MPNLIEQMLPGLKANRLAGLRLPKDQIFPQYQGQSILNLPSTICRLLGAPELRTSSLIPELIDPLIEGGPVQRVILILMDALGLHMFQRWLESGGIPVWDRLMQSGLIAPLTSIVPSTTSAALTSLWTGSSPAEHGVVGYTVWLKEYGLVANMIDHSPSSFDKSLCGPGLLTCAGFNPATFLNQTTLGTHLSTHGIQAHAFQHYTIAYSGLSTMFYKDVNIHSFGTPTDLWINLMQTMASRPDERQFIWVYWGDVDHLAHVYGPDDQRPAEEFALFSDAFEKLFLTRLPSMLKKNTLLILTGDHGGASNPQAPNYELRLHPALENRLHILPTGEARLAYLHVKPGEVEAAREYIQRTWPQQFTLLDPAEAVRAGLFGPGEPHPRLPDRIGDLIMAARGQAYLWSSQKENNMLGRHGGLSPEEMLVPFLAARLDRA